MDEKRLKEIGIERKKIKKEWNEAQDKWIDCGQRMRKLMREESAILKLKKEIK